MVLLPPALVFVWRTAGRAVAGRALAAFAVVVAAIVGPFLALAPHGLSESFRAQAARGLQVESLGGALLGVSDRLGLNSATVVHRTGHAISYELTGSLPDALAVLSSVAQAAAVLLVAWLYVRGRDDPWRLAAAFAAAVTGFLAFTRFFSPQYLVWLVPFVVFWLCRRGSLQRQRSSWHRSGFFITAMCSRSAVTYGSSCSATC